MRTSLLSAFLVLLALLAPAFLGPASAYVSCLWALRRWTVGAALLWFVVLRQTSRLALRLAMRHPGGRLRAGEGQ